MMTEETYIKELDELKKEIFFLRKEVTDLNAECLRLQEVANNTLQKEHQENRESSIYFTGLLEGKDSLKTENEMLKAIIENMGVGVGITDNNGNMLSLNKAALKMHGFQSEEEMFSPFKKYTEEFELKYPDGRIMPIEEWPTSRAIKEDFVQDYEVKLTRHNSKISRYINYSAVPVYNDFCELMLIVFHMTDITDMKLVKEAILKSEKRYSYIFDNRENELPGVDIMEVEQTERALVYERELLRLNEQRLEGIFDNTAIGIVGQFATVFEDISDQKRSEQEIKQKNEELTRFIYTVSLDLKSPLVTIKSFASFLKSDIENKDNEALDRDIGYIINAADKMGKLLDELLELSRIGRKEEKKVEHPLREIAQAAIDLVAGRINNGKVKIEFVGPPVMLYGHSHRLIQLYQNLLDNAVKFMGSQPDPLVEIGTSIEKDKVVLFVRDNGVGIDPRYHHKIFGLFEKLDNSKEGTGIGLALVKRIVEVHGGSIWFVSEGTGKGTTFYFTLERTYII